MKNRTEIVRITKQNLNFSFIFYLAKSATAPATTGEATLVPDKTLQPETKFEPRTDEPYVTRSGFIRP